MVKWRIKCTYVLLDYYVHINPYAANVENVVSS